MLPDWESRHFRHTSANKCIKSGVFRRALARPFEFAEQDLRKRESSNTVRTKRRLPPRSSKKIFFCDYLPICLEGVERSTLGDPTPASRDLQPRDRSSPARPVRKVLPGPNTAVVVQQGDRKIPREKILWCHLLVVKDFSCKSLLGQLVLDWTAALRMSLDSKVPVKTKTHKNRKNKTEQDSSHRARRKKTVSSL